MTTPRVTCKERSISIGSSAAILTAKLMQKEVFAEIILQATHCFVSLQPCFVDRRVESLFRSRWTLEMPPTARTKTWSFGSCQKGTTELFVVMIRSSLLCSAARLNSIRRNLQQAGQRREQLPVHQFSICLGLRLGSVGQSRYWPCSLALRHMHASGLGFLFFENLRTRQQQLPLLFLTS